MKRAYTCRLPNVHSMHAAARYRKHLRTEAIAAAPAWRDEMRDNVRGDGFVGMSGGGGEISLNSSKFCQLGEEEEERREERKAYTHHFLNVRGVHDAAKCRARLRTEAMVAARVGDRREREEIDGRMSSG